MGLPVQFAAPLVEDEIEGQISVANLPVTAYLDNPPAASVEQFACRMGEKAAETLLQIMDNPPLPGMAMQDILIETRLVVHG